MRRLSLWAVTMTLVGGIACAGAGSGGTGGGSDATLTSQQIRQVQSRYSDMYGLIQSLRPGWLQNRGAVSFQQDQAQLPVVFLNGTRQGRIPDPLRGISPANVQEAEFLDASEATLRHGTGYAGGIIDIRTRSGG